MKKKFIILLTIFCMLSCFYKSISILADDDPLEHYHDDDDSWGESGGAYDNDEIIDTWQVDDLCKINENVRGDIDDEQLGIIIETEASAYNYLDITNSSDIPVYKNMTTDEEYTPDEHGKIKLYSFTIASQSYGIYGSKENAINVCKGVYNAINTVQERVKDSNEPNAGIEVKGINGTSKVIYLDPNCETTDGCGLTTRHIHKEEAMQLFFSLIANTDNHFEKENIWGKTDSVTANVELESYYEDVVDRDIEGELVNPIFDVKLNDGSLFETQKEKDDRREINDIIYQNLSGSTTRYSAYERFGGDIYFVPYYGEQTFSIGPFDKIFSALTQGKELSLSTETFNILDASPVILSTKAYYNRAPVLNKELIRTNGLSDPRVDAYSVLNFSLPRETAKGNTYLKISKVFVGIFNFFLEDKALTKMMEFIEYVQTSSTWSKLIKPLIYIMIGIGTLGFLYTLFIHAKRYAQGKEDARPFFGRIIGGTLTLGILLVLANDATKVNFIPNTIKDITKALANANLSTLVHNNNGLTDDIIYSTNSSEMLSAATWKVSVFNPWCRGTFQKDYEELYTQYDESGGKKLEQSYQDPNVIDEEFYHTANEYGEPTYDSAGMTGDVSVPLGGGDANLVRNWALFAWSTQSIYHIDSNKARYITTNDAGETTDANGNPIYLEEVSWPNAYVTPGNNEIYIDSFRWIDAKLNISPMYIENGTKAYNYPTANPYEQTFVKEGRNSIILMLLLYVLSPMIYLKYKSYLYLSILGVELIYYGIINLFKERSFNTLKDKYVQNIVGFATAQIKLLILVTLYYIFLNSSSADIVDKILYVILALVIQFVDIKKIKREVKSFSKYNKKNRAKRNSSIDVYFNCDWNRPEVCRDVIDAMRVIYSRYSHLDRLSGVFKDIDVMKACEGKARFTTGITSNMMSDTDKAHSIRLVELLKARGYKDSSLVSQDEVITCYFHDQRSDNSNKDKDDASSNANT